MITLSKIHEIEIYKNANIIICIIYFILLKNILFIQCICFILHIEHNILM